MYKARDLIDETNNVVSSVLDEESMKVIRKVDQAKPEDKVTSDFFEYLLSKKLRVGYNVDDMRGIIDLGEIGDLYFGMSSNDPSVFFSINDKHFTHSFKVSMGESVKSVIESILKFRKVVNNYSE